MERKVFLNGLKGKLSDLEGEDPTVCVSFWRGAMLNLIFHPDIITQLRCQSTC
jgi:hypothetical protein